MYNNQLKSRPFKRNDGKTVFQNLIDTLYIHIKENHQTLIKIKLIIQVNGDNNGHEDEAAFTDVKLEVPSSSPNEAAASAASNYDRGERVKGEIAMLSPALHHHNNSVTSSSEPPEKSTTQDINIKSFVPSKPLPIPTPSRLVYVYRFS